MKTNNIKRIRILYGIFAFILLTCLGLYLSNIITAAEKSGVEQLAQLRHDNYVFSITDLQAGSRLYSQEHPIDSLAQGVDGHAHVSGYTVDFYSDKECVRTDSRASWVVALQLLEVLAIIALMILTIVVLISFYRSLKRGKVFPTRQVSLLTVIGLLILATTITRDTAAFLERSLAFDLLQNSTWECRPEFVIHFDQIFFGLSIIFLAQILHIGREMQEDQELTI